MDSTRVDTVVFPRGHAQQTFAVPLDFGSVVAPETQMQQYRMPNGPRLDPRYAILQPIGWLKEPLGLVDGVPFDPVDGVAALNQMQQYRVRGMAPLRHEYHLEYYNDGWVHPLVDDNVRQWFAAIDTETKQYRMPRGPAFIHSLHTADHQRYEYMQDIVDEFVVLSTPARNQLTQSFRSTGGYRRLDLTRDLEAPEVEWVIEPVTTDLQNWWAAVYNLTQQYRMPDGPRLDYRQTMTHLNEVNQGVFIDEYDIFKFPPIHDAMQQYRMPDGGKLDMARHVDPLQHPEWIQTLVDDYAVITLPARSELSNSFRMADGMRFDVRTHTDLFDRAAWIQEHLTAIVPQIQPAIDMLVRSFRLNSKTGLNVLAHTESNIFAGWLSELFGGVTPIDPIELVASWWQQQQYRMRDRDKLDLSRHTEPLQHPEWLQTLIDDYTIITTPARSELSGSYRMADSQRLDVRRHLDLFGRGEWIQEHLTELVPKIQPAVDMLVQSYRLGVRTGLDVLSQTESSVFAGWLSELFDAPVTPIDPIELVASWAQQQQYRMPDAPRTHTDMPHTRQGFATPLPLEWLPPVFEYVRQYRMPDGKKFEFPYHATSIPNDWIFKQIPVPPIDPTELVASWWQQQQYRMRDVSHDHIYTLFRAKPFQAFAYGVSTAAITSFTQSQQYRMPDGPRLDVRLNEWFLMQGWITAALDIEPLDPQIWPAIYFLTQSFKADGPPVLDMALQEYIQNLDWIKEPLGLIDVVTDIFPFRPVLRVRRR